MKIDDYEIVIKSTHHGVKETYTNNGIVFVGVLGAAYEIKIYNNNPDYRIWASLHIDGMPVMLNNWGRLAKPNDDLSWLGFEIDNNNVREFVFVADEKQTAAYQQGVTGFSGKMDFCIIREKIKWVDLNPSKELFPMMLGTGMGDFRESKTRQAKIKFRWGGPEEKFTIPYGSVNDFMDHQNKKPDSILVKTEKWYRFTYQATRWDSFSPPYQQEEAYTLVLHPDGSLICTTINNGHEELHPMSSNQMLYLSNEIKKMTADPIHARAELDSSTTTSHAEHANPISILLEKFENIDCKIGHTILSWEGDGMTVNDGLLQKITQWAN